MIENNPGHINAAITFFYYKDTRKANHFYREVLGLTLAIDQDWSKIYKVSEGAFVGVVDESKGAQRANEIKPVELTLLVEDVDAWYQYLREQDVEILSEPKTLEDLQLRMFLIHDPEGYLIEIQKFLK